MTIVVVSFELVWCGIAGVRAEFCFWIFLLLVFARSTLAIGAFFLINQNTNLAFGLALVFFLKMKPSHEFLANKLKKHDCIFLALAASASHSTKLEVNYYFEKRRGLHRN